MRTSYLMRDSDALKPFGENTSGSLIRDGALRAPIFKLLADELEGFLVQGPRRAWKNHLLFNLNVDRVKSLQLLSSYRQSLPIGCIEHSNCDPSTIEAIHLGVKAGCDLVILLKTVKLYERLLTGSAAETRKERLFFVCIVARAAHPKILERSLDRSHFFIVQRSVRRAFHHQAENVDEVLDSAMAIGKHANWIVEPAVGFCAYLYCHSSLPRDPGC